MAKERAQDSNDPEKAFYIQAIKGTLDSADYALSLFQGELFIGETFNEDAILAIFYDPVENQYKLIGFGQWGLKRSIATIDRLQLPSNLEDQELEDEESNDLNNPVAVVFFKENTDEPDQPIILLCHDDKCSTEDALGRVKRILRKFILKAN